MIQYPPPDFDVVVSLEKPIPQSLTGCDLQVRIYAAGQTWQGGMLILPALLPAEAPNKRKGWLWCSHPERLEGCAELPRTTVVSVINDPMGSEFPEAKGIRFTLHRLEASGGVRGKAV